MKNKKTLYVFGAVLLIAFGLMYLGTQNASEITRYWNDTNVACLPNGHADVAVHTHTVLEVYVDGQQQTIPGNVGIEPGCMAEVHTHGPDNEIHVEFVDSGGEMTLGDFYKVWGQDMQRSGYGLEVYVNDDVVWGSTSDQKTIPSPEEVVLEDHDVIRLEYTSTR